MAATASATTIAWRERLGAWLKLLPVRFDDRRFWLRAALGYGLRTLALRAPLDGLRAAMTHAVVWSLPWLGVNATRGGSHSLLVQAQTVHISTMCTHIEVFALLAPLLWSRQDGIVHNGTRLALAFGAIMLLGVLRIDTAILLYSAGIPWELSHDMLLGVCYALTIGWVLRRNAWMHPPRKPDLPLVATAN